MTEEIMETQYAKKLSGTSGISNRFRQMIKDHNMTQKTFLIKLEFQQDIYRRFLLGMPSPAGLC